MSRRYTVSPPLLTLVLALELVAPACGQNRDTGTTEPSLAELIASLSEQGGYFDTDNLVSNEASYAEVVERLPPTGGAYIGVGPEQNFTYIARTRPRWAFIVDVRRDNLLHNLLLQTILVHAATPDEYLAWLFSRPPPTHSAASSDVEIDERVHRLEAEPRAAARFETNLETIAGHISDDLRIPLSSHDRETLRSIYLAFFRDQLELRFRSHGRPVRPYHPSYRELLLARTPAGRPAHFLASNEDYAFVRSLARHRRLVPVVGDLAGSQALLRIATFLDERGETVSTFYTSNVEFYLLRSGRFDTWVENLRALPRTDDSLLLRAYFDYGHSHPQSRPGYRSTMVLQRVTRFLDLYDAGEYRDYWDVCTRDYLK